MRSRLTMPHAIGILAVSTALFAATMVVVGKPWGRPDVVPTSGSGQSDEAASAAQGGDATTAGEPALPTTAVPDSLGALGERTGDGEAGDRDGETGDATDGGTGDSEANDRTDGDDAAGEDSVAEASSPDESKPGRDQDPSPSGEAARPDGSPSSQGSAGSSGDSGASATRRRGGDDDSGGWPSPSRSPGPTDRSEPDPPRFRAPASPACAVSYVVRDKWESGYVADVTITNTGDSMITGWTLTWRFREGETKVNAWNATWHQQGASVSAGDVGWNAVIPPGARASFGFQVQHHGSSVAPPTAFALRGTSCR